MPNAFSPAESIFLSTPLGLDELGSDFDPLAPFTACRLCGALMQTARDRLSYELMGEGEVRLAQLIASTETENRHNWLRRHEKVCHPLSEIEAFSKTGWAMTPEAAHKLAPFGIAPMGNLDGGIVDAMATAPRAPINGEVT